ncbi:MAG: DUF362 domain-containing protein, partial [Deltaproteobacteria bacterium]|nr:DUF362 domain-containing protein [Deltaproteobacteria bacterium]
AGASGAGGPAGAVAGTGARTGLQAASDLVVCAGNDPYAQTLKAIEALGGIDLFVKKGDRVVLTPNLAFARLPEQGANTHPRVVRAVIDACVRAGAARITVLDHVLDAAAVAFKRNGAEEAVQVTVATLLAPREEGQYQKVDVAGLKVHAARGLAQAVAREVLAADALISMPVIKDHDATRFSGALKKVMGVIWERREYHRAGIHECIAEISTLVRPTLIVADATRVMQTGGPKGPGEVSKPNHVLCAVDPVLADAYCCRYLTKDGPLKHTAVLHIVQAATLLGTRNLGSPKLLEVTA